MKKTIDLEKHRDKYRQFKKGRNTLILSMLDDEGKPFSSCAPFVEKDGKLYVYISRVADHYRLLENSKFADALIIADEATTNNKFATERARWSCIPKNIGNDGHEDIFTLFNETCGEKMVEMLRGLDFSLFELTPLQGRYVVGFGLAFDVDLDGSTFTHVVIDKEKDAVRKA
ncbi:pyridoxamine 5'-phosphate oxidase family protein [Bacillus niameyensis]|uniref:pyridoxamine 5'-phosphate oxidase family protein n=1 Tax=Bacillus niameyensis TaxID=1522308 RepID=UPI0007830BD7|nr:pyridoxamine 5'-phosphate oxidase family protein [Bacillus niameyensis]